MDTTAVKMDTVRAVQQDSQEGSGEIGGKNVEQEGSEEHFMIACSSYWWM